MEINAGSKTADPAGGQASGKTLRSLHQFMDQSPHPYAVRLYSGKLELMETQTIEGRRYWLLNLPYFLAGRLNDYVGWMVEQLADKRNLSIKIF